MWNLFVLLLIWLSELLLRRKCWLFERKIWQQWDSNPHTHSCTRSLKGEFLESGALDCSSILPWVYRTCFILSSITPSCNVKSVCLASHLTLRTTASTKMLAVWTQNLTGVGFEPTHTFVYQKSQRRISWVWRLRTLGHPALSISHLLHPVFDNTFLLCEICFVLLLIWLSEILLRPKCWLFERKIWQEWDSILLRLKCCLFERKIWQEWD